MSDIRVLSQGMAVPPHWASVLWQLGTCLKDKDSHCGFNNQDKQLSDPNTLKLRRTCSTITSNS